MARNLESKEFKSFFLLHLILGIHLCIPIVVVLHDTLQKRFLVASCSFVFFRILQSVS